MKHPDLSQSTSHVHVAASPGLNRRDRVISRFCRIFVAACLGFTILVYLFVSGSFTPVVNHVKCLSNGVAGIDCHVPTTVEGHPNPLTPRPNERDESAFKNSSNKVPLEAHIMSKCPDARDCLQQLVVPAMEQVSGLVDFDLSFIAR